MKSITAAYRDIGNYITPIVVLALLFLLPFFWKVCSNETHSIKKAPIGLTVLIVFLLFASTYAPSFFGEGNIGPRRVQNLRLMLCIMSSVYMELLIVWKLKTSFLKSTGDKWFLDSEEASSFGEPFAGYMAVIVGLAAFCIAIFVIPKENRNQIAGISAARSLLIGEAQGYARQMEERLELYHSDEKDILVTRPDYYPELLYYIDYDVSTTDDSFMVNEWIGKHYDKNSVMREASEKD